MTIDPSPAPRVVSYGGGVQSTALLVLAARGVIDYRTFLMANVGDDSEDPRTLEFVRDVAGPYAERHGIELHLLDRRTRDGEIETLWSRLMREGSRSLPIPIRMDNGKPGGRACTADFKTRVTGKWLRQHGAHGGKPCPPHRAEDTATRGEQTELGLPPSQRRRPTPRPDCDDCLQPNPATIALGISLDEIQRTNLRRVDPHEQIVYPLVGLGEETGLKMTRQDCVALIADEGLPVPPKSACFFCPFHTPRAWVDLRRERPDLFAKSVQLERTLNSRRVGKDPVWLTRFAQPIDEVIPEPEALLPGFGEQFVDDAAGDCDSGRCFT